MLKKVTKKPKRGLTLTAGPAIHELVLGNTVSTGANNSTKYLVLIPTSQPFVTQMRMS